MQNIVLLPSFGGACHSKLWFNKYTVDRKKVGAMLELFTQDYVRIGGPLLITLCVCWWIGGPVGIAFAVFLALCLTMLCTYKYMAWHHDNVRIPRQKRAALSDAHSMRQFAALDVRAMNEVLASTYLVRDRFGSSVIAAAEQVHDEFEQLSQALDQQAKALTETELIDLLRAADAFRAIARRASSAKSDILSKTSHANMRSEARRMPNGRPFRSAVRPSSMEDTGAFYLPQYPRLAEGQDGTTHTTGYNGDSSGDSGSSSSGSSAGSD